MAIWADKGTPAALSTGLSTEPPVGCVECPEAFQLIRTWLKICEQTHDECRKAICGTQVEEDNPPELPTRVLDVGRIGAKDLILKETNGLRGKFCALSYCWGPCTVDTLMTTESNLEKHRSKIEYDALPKTLQDTVKVTREIGIRYLWIDRLCIVQDSKEDWDAESKRMDSVYQNAHLLEERHTACTVAECPDWEWILSRYSERQLTHKTDRLRAVEGVARAFLRARADEYRWGVFQSGLPSQLLWMRSHIETGSDDLAGVPSWSWAARGGEKKFWGIGMDSTQEISSEQIRIDSSGNMSLHGLVEEYKMLRYETQQDHMQLAEIWALELGVKQRKGFDILASRLGDGQWYPTTSVSK
ncbi:hypothetical protein DL765_010345 [Monosporascus sp. GIB2]|nr:hypothetical protein DL765_010345 [Monosporascus sp. GIB2]